MLHVSATPRIIVIGCWLFNHAAGPTITGPDTHQSHHFDGPQCMLPPAQCAQLPHACNNNTILSISCQVAQADAVLWQHGLAERAHAGIHTPSLS